MQTLNALLADLRAAAARIEVHVDLMKTAGLEQVTVVSGQPEMERGLIGINNFATNLEGAIRSARIGRGDFGVAHPGESPAKAEAKPRGRPRKPAE